ncbi:hypothetical protein [Allofustis seminis]|nr:hypothetical protein [Allofustis seminis]
MDKEKWLGTWWMKDTEKNGKRNVEAEFEAGIIPSALLIGIVIYLISKMF